MMMQLTSLLIIWWLPLLETGGPDLPPDRASAADAPHAAAHIAPWVMHRTGESSLPDDPCSGSPGFSAEDEEDPFEDGFFADGYWLSRSRQDLGPGCLAFLAPVPHDHLRISSHPHPLRC